MMQFQSDLLNIPVRVPDAEELSGIGAAYMAGLAVKLYDDAVFEQLNRVSFSPDMATDIREKKMYGWQDAVQRARSK